MLEEQSQMKKRINIWLPLLLSTVMVLGMVIGIKMQPSPPKVQIVNSSNKSKALGQGRIEELIRYIEAKYVDEVDREEIIKKAISQIMDQLDPHSNYIPKEQLAGVNEQLEGSFDGIGIEFMMLDDTIVVVKPIKDGPSEKAGVLAGDRIVEISDTLVAGVNYGAEGIMDLLRGETDSEVKVGVRRLNQDSLQYFSIKRGKIPVNSVDVAYMLDDETGFIKINRFSASTYQEFIDGLSALEEENEMKNLVIDLRQNPGGYLQEATNILSQLFDEKEKLMVYTEGRAVHRSDYETSGRNLYNIEEVVVLIDEGSASASEILAGAVQDWDRGVLIGRRSFGKGLVQEQYPLSDGSALRLTVARYYTPSGRSIQRNYTDKDAYDRDVMSRFENGELYDKDSISVSDTTQFETMGGRVVYGGGGIIPDIFVPLDSTLMSETYLRLRQDIPPFVYRYVEDNQATFSEMDFNYFVNKYDVPDQLLEEYLNSLSTDEYQVSTEEWNNIKPQLARFMKARMGKHLFDDKGFFAVWNKKDEMVVEALKTLRNEQYLTKLMKQK